MGKTWGWLMKTVGNHQRGGRLQRFCTMKKLFLHAPQVGSPWACLGPLTHVHVPLTYSSLLDLFKILQVVCMEISLGNGAYPQLGPVRDVLGWESRLRSSLPAPCLWCRRSAEPGNGRPLSPAPWWQDGSERLRSKGHTLAKLILLASWGSGLPLPGSEGQSTAPFVGTPHSCTSPPQGLSCDEMTVLAALKRIKQLWAFFLTPREGRELVPTEHVVVSPPLEKRTILFVVYTESANYWHDFSITTCTIEHEKREEGRCVSAIKLPPGSTSAEQRVLLYVGVDLPPSLIWLGASWDNMQWNPKTIWN